MNKKPETDPQKDDPGLNAGDAGDLDADEKEAFDRIMAEVGGQDGTAEGDTALNAEELGKLDDILSNADSTGAARDGDGETQEQLRISSATYRSPASKPPYQAAKEHMRKSKGQPQTKQNGNGMQHNSTGTSDASIAKDKNT